MFTERGAGRARTIGRCCSDRRRHGRAYPDQTDPSHDHIRSWLGDLPGPVAVAYEAGPTGFGLSRALSAGGSGAKSSHRRSSSDPAVTR